MSGWALAVPGFTVTDRYDIVNTDDKQTAVTASATPHTKGSWVELDASTSQDAYLINVNLHDSSLSGTNTGMLVDIGIGGSGSEVVLIPNLLAGWKSGSNSTVIPLYIPAGNRLSARVQAVIGSDTVNVGVRLLSSPNSFLHDMRQFGNVVTYGADEANSRGTRVFSSVADAKGAWIELTASTTEPHSAIGVSAQGDTDVSLTGQTPFIDIGFGAISSEEMLLSNLRCATSSSEIVRLEDLEIAAMGIGRTLPVGTRLVVRCQYPTTANEDLSICLHGVT